MQTSLKIQQGEFTLNRYPLQKNDTLRAWDAADELALAHVATLEGIDKTKKLRTLIINDHFGALTVALQDFSPTLLSDSFIAQQGAIYNLQQNQLPALQFIDSMQALQGSYDLVIIKVQKSLAQLEDQLYKLREHLHSNSIIVGCGMVKMIHCSTLALFEKLIGPTTTSLAKKKARLVFCEFNKDLTVKSNPFPQSFILENHGWNILNHANVFSRAKLDLGCGNGILGLVAANNNPNASIAFYDESYMAVASAEHNFKHAFDGARSASFKVTDCLGNTAASSADLILNNPPFHQQNAIGDFIAWQMFSQSFQALKKSGELWVIGNSHLGYQQKIKKLFGNCQKVTSNSKFVILRAIK